ncbi:hypothetical protein A6A04_20010 [Paramagnetospirillum marisnigri]|jgi:hypothetical protein|uniref:Uncharacterized protein n=1 Tax=Paramagnetospirillum marisnigri TaxID=1285242 RepID=A0A178MJ16_9PROT|nr:hypothetical protein A6A04_20010 [Paramagnetospirillum marisnigri]
MSFTGEPLTCFDQKTRIILAKTLLLEVERDRFFDTLQSELRHEPIPDIRLTQAVAAAMPERHSGEGIADWLKRGILTKI